MRCKVNSYLLLKIVTERDVHPIILAKSAKVRTRTAKRLISGQQETAPYDVIEKFAKMLNIEPQSLMKSHTASEIKALYGDDDIQW